MVVSIRRFFLKILHLLHVFLHDMLSILHLRKGSILFHRNGNSDHGSHEVTSCIPCEIPDCKVRK